MTLTKTTAPTTYPVSLAQAKEHLRIGTSMTADDSYILGCIAAATEAVEGMTERQLMSATYTLTLDGFPRGQESISMPIVPTRGISGVTYLDIEGNTATLEAAAYTQVVDKLYPVPSSYWPVAYPRPDSVCVVYLAGYPTSADVPVSLTAAILLIVGDLYESRQSQIVGTITTTNPTVEALVRPFQRVEFR